MNTQEALAIVAAMPDYRLLRRVPETVAPQIDGSEETGLALIVDTETTGMDRQHDKIIEIGMLLVRFARDSGRVVELVGSYGGLEDPGEPLSEVVRTVTGLTDEELAGQTMSDEAVLALASRAEVVIAHNAAFDRPFLERRWPSFNQMAFACSINEIDWMAAGHTSAKLELLVYHCGHFYDSHRALNDCWALLFMLEQPLGPDGVPALAQLMARMRAPSFLLNLQVRYDDKDKLKALGGFQWQDIGSSGLLAKSWLKRCHDKHDLRRVLEAVHQQVFDGQPFPCRIGKVGARQRYRLDSDSIDMKSYQYPH